MGMSNLLSNLLKKLLCELISLLPRALWYLIVGTNVSPFIFRCTFVPIVLLWFSRRDILGLLTVLMPWYCRKLTQRFFWSTVNNYDMSLHSSLSTTLQYSIHLILFKASIWDNVMEVDCRTAVVSCDWSKIKLTAPSLVNTPRKLPLFCR